MLSKTYYQYISYSRRFKPIPSSAANGNSIDFDRVYMLTKSIGNGLVCHGMSQKRQNTALRISTISKNHTYHKSIAFVHDSLYILTIESRVVSKLVVQLRIQLASGYQSKDPYLMSLHIKAQVTTADIHGSSQCHTDNTPISGRLVPASQAVPAPRPASWAGYPEISIYVLRQLASLKIRQAMPGAAILDIVSLDNQI